MAPGDFACSTIMKGHLEVFLRDEAGQLAHRWCWPGPSWDEWRTLPAPGPVGAVAAVDYGIRYQAMAVAVDGAVHYRYWRVNARGEHEWSDWAGMPPLDAAIKDLAFLPVYRGPLVLLALDTTGRIRMRLWQPPTGIDPQVLPWSDWGELPGPPGQVTAVAADSASASRQLFVALADGGVWERAWWPTANTWADWTPLPPQDFRAVDVECLATSSRHFSITAIDEEGRLRRSWAEPDADESCRDWTEVPPPPTGQASGPPTGIATGEDDFVVLTADGAVSRLYELHDNGVSFRWTPWPSVLYG
jgi:hypothetical protein